MTSRFSGCFFYCFIAWMNSKREGGEDILNFSSITSAYDDSEIIHLKIDRGTKTEAAWQWKANVKKVMKQKLPTSRLSYNYNFFANHMRRATYYHISIWNYFAIYIIRLGSPNSLCALMVPFCRSLLHMIPI